MLLFILAALVTTFIVIYIFARPYLIEHWGFWQKFCAWVDPFVVSWLSKSRQIAIARLTGATGALAGLFATFTDIPVDWQALFDMIVQLFPASLQPWIQKAGLPLLIWAYGEFMRRVSREPVAAKE